MPATSTPAEETIASCSFCGKPDSKVERLVAGPGVFICNECVDLSATIIADSAPATPEESSNRRRAYYERPAAEVLATLPALVRSAARVEAELAGWIERLRKQGTDWPIIAAALEMSVDATRGRFGVTPPA